MSAYAHLYYCNGYASAIYTQDLHCGEILAFISCNRKVLSCCLIAIPLRHPSFLSQSCPIHYRKPRTLHVPKPSSTVRSTSQDTPPNSSVKSADAISHPIHEYPHRRNNKRPAPPTLPHVRATSPYIIHTPPATPGLSLVDATPRHAAPEARPVRRRAGVRSPRGTAVVVVVVGVVWTALEVGYRSRGVVVAAVVAGLFARGGDETHGLLLLGGGNGGASGCPIRRVCAFRRRRVTRNLMLMSEVVLATGV